MLAALEKWAAAIGFWLIAIVLFFWTFLEQFLVLSHERVISVAMALLGLLVLYFDRRLNKVLAREKPVVRLAIAEALGRVFQSTRSIQHLRIAALTGEVITPLFSHQDISMNRVDVLSRHLNSHQLNERTALKPVDWITAEWLEMKGKGKVRRLEMAKYKGIPNCYLVIIDTRYMVFGPYYPDAQTTTGVETGQAFLVDGSTEGGASMIEAWTAAFDKQFLHWRNNSP